MGRFSQLRLRGPKQLDCFELDNDEVMESGVTGAVVAELSCGTSTMVNKRTRETNNEIFERQARICKAFAHPGGFRFLTSWAAARRVSRICRRRWEFQRQECLNTLRF